MAEIKVSWDFDSAVFKPWLGLNSHFHILETSSKLGKEKKKTKQNKNYNPVRRGLQGSGRSWGRGTNVIKIITGKACFNKKVIISFR